MSLYMSVLQELRRMDIYYMILNVISRYVEFSLSVYELQSSCTGLKARMIKSMAIVATLPCHQCSIAKWHQSTERENNDGF